MFLVIIYFVFYVALGIKTANSYGNTEAALLQTSAFSLIISLMSLSLTVRRLHDIGKSGFWYFIQFIPVIGSIILLIWTLKNSEMFDNRFGPVPNLVMQ